MSFNSKIENLIRDYLLEEGILKEKLSNVDFDFGFVFTYPPGLNRQNISIYKPKKSNTIFISIRYQISEDKAQILNSLKQDQKNQLFYDLRRYFLIKEVYFSIDIQKMIIEIHELIYPQKEKLISKNSVFKKFQKVFYCFIYSNLIVEEYCLGKQRAADDFNSTLFS